MTCSNRAVEPSNAENENTASIFVPLKSLCGNHDDGSTGAVVSCEDCTLSLCAECDKILHLPKRMRDHNRQVGILYSVQDAALSLGWRSKNNSTFFSY